LGVKTVVERDTGIPLKIMGRSVLLHLVVVSNAFWAASQLLHPLPSPTPTPIPQSQCTTGLLCCDTIIPTSNPEFIALEPALIANNITIPPGGTVFVGVGCSIVLLFDTAEGVASCSQTLACCEEFCCKQPLNGPILEPINIGLSCEPVIPGE